LLLNLFKEKERKLLKENCKKHCTDNGIIFFSCFSIKDRTFGIGKENEKRNIHENLGSIFLNIPLKK
jgi:hypothetical protein